MFHVKQIKNMSDFDIIVVGGGHAGIEAAAASAKMNCTVALLTMDPGKIGLMSCNPAIGGLAKGQLVREIDALGGEMGKIIDATGIHFKMLNKSKGPAVWSPRAQADRKFYALEAQNRLYNIPDLEIIQGMAIGIIIKNGRVGGVSLENGKILKSKSVILTNGTFLNGQIYIGLNSIRSGRAGETNSYGITESLVNLGFEAGRLKTGTPPRLDRNTIDFSMLEEQVPDNPPQPFSFSTKEINRKQISCFITHTNEITHKALRKGFDRSPMFTGRIKSIGPRYCPSIEDKINRFAERERHQLFLEPEGYDNREIYLNGFSTSLPEEVQVDAISTIPGLESAKVIRLGYAVEYDFFPPYQLNFTLETKKINGLFFAGQINGTSGYEEAAAQGIVAGINAALQLQNKEPFKLSRTNSYIGVLIDDLINKNTLEPYRMFTSRAEYRLFLRQDNADLRLSEYGNEYGLLNDEEWERVSRKKEKIKSLKSYIEITKITPAKFSAIYKDSSSSLSQPQTIKSLIKRPEVKLKDLIITEDNNNHSEDAVQEVEFFYKYEGYLKRNLELINKFKEKEHKKIPKEIDYKKINALSAEAKDKLYKIQPDNLGQASRISGVTPADISVLMIYIEKFNQRSDVSRETKKSNTESK